MTNNLKYVLVTFLALTVNGCSGGGGGGDETGGNGDPVFTSGENWEAQAGIVKDGCGERIAPVRQIFSFNGDRVNTGILETAVADTDSGFTFGFEDSIGNCNRSYLGEFININGDTAEVRLTSTSNCGGQICENQWVGTASRLAN